MHSTLRKLLQIHPELHYNIVLRDDNKPYLNNITDSPIFFDDIVEYKDSWTELGESQTNYIFQTYYFDHTQETKPLWKILVIPKTSQLVLLLSHAMYDGMSSVKVWSSFMSCLQEVASLGSTATGSKLDPVIYQEEDATVKTGTKNHPYTRWPIPTWWKVKRQIVSLLFRVSPKSILGPDPKLLRFEGYTFPEGFLCEEVPQDRDKYSRRYKVRNDNIQYMLHLTSDQLHIVKGQCKVHGVSLTSFIVSLFAFSLKAVIHREGVTTGAANNNNNSNDSGSHIKVDIPMDTRVKCETLLPDVLPNELQLGNFIASIEYTDDIAKYDSEDDKVIWKISQSVQAKICGARTSQLDDIINNVKLLEVVNDVAQFVDQKLDASNGVGPGGTFEVTNLGFVDYGGHCSESSSSSEFYVRDAQWNEPQGFSNIFTCCVLSTPLGGLNCSISVPRGIATEFGSVLENVRRLLRDC